MVLVTPRLWVCCPYVPPSELDSVILVGPFKLRIFCESVCFVLQLWYIKASGLVKHYFLSFLLLGKNLNLIPLFESFKQSECYNLLCVVPDKSASRLGYSFPGYFFSLGLFYSDTVFLIISLNTSIYLSFPFLWLEATSSVIRHWFCYSTKSKI